MVNTGKPSTACFQCRHRRIKCDAARPECERCVKHGVQCPGYPDGSQVVFRDVTTKTRQRAIRKYKKRGTALEDSALQSASESEASDAGEGSSSMALVAGRQDEPASSCVPMSCGIIVTDRDEHTLLEGAITAFINQWTTSDLEVFWAAFDSVSMLYPAVSRSDCFSSALVAVSLLSTALTGKDESRNGRRAAIEAYGTALQAIKQTLEDPRQQTADHTFIAIEMLCLFEVCTGYDSATEGAQMHLQGVLAIAKMRGPSQFATVLGQRLFLTACVLWNVSTIAQPSLTSMALPPSLWQALFECHLGSYEPVFRLFPIVDRAAEVRRLAGQTLSLAGSYMDRKALLLLLAQVHSTDQEFIAWQYAPIQKWSSQDDFYTIFTHNLSRCHRIFLLDIKHQIYKHLHEAEDMDYSTELQQCVDTAHQLVDDMCATMPYSFGPGKFRTRAAEKTAIPSDVPHQDFIIAFHILFSPPLLVASMVSSLSDERKAGVEAARMECMPAIGQAERPRSDAVTLFRL